MWLYVGVGSIEQGFGMFNCQIFGDIYEFVVFVVVFVWVFFSVFVGQQVILCFYDLWIGVVFGCNQFNVCFLMFFFCLYGVLEFVVKVGDFYFMIKYGCVVFVCLVGLGIL